MFEYPGHWKAAENYVDALKEFEQTCELFANGGTLETFLFKQIQQFVCNQNETLPEKVLLVPHVFQGLFTGEYLSFGDPDLSGDQTEANRVSYCLQFDLTDDVEFTVKC